MAKNVVEQREAVHQVMFQTLLRTPHRRQADEILHIHKEQFALDPNFYGKLAVWAVYLENNPVRDVNEIFIAMLFASEFPEHREAAYVMFQDLPPYQANRVRQYFTGHREVYSHVSISKNEMPVHGQFGVRVEPMVYRKGHPQAGKKIPRETVKLTDKIAKSLVKKGQIKSGQKEYYVDKYVVHHAYLNKRSVNNNFIRSAIRDYLRFRESNIDMLQGALIRARADIKDLYFRSHTLPGGDVNSWINRYLFKGEIDADNAVATRLVALKQLSSVKDPVEQAKMIVEHKLPYSQVCHALSNITPTVLVALVDSMSPQELLSNLDSLKRRGAFDNADVRALVESRLVDAKKSKGKRMDATKGAGAAKTLGLPENIAKLATDVSDAQLKRVGTIKGRVAILIDKSGSMSAAIELGKDLAALAAQACGDANRPRVFMFDTMSTEIVWSDKDGDITTKSAWDKKLSMFKASGGTEPHNVLRAMISRDIQVDQMLVVTDEGESNVGRFATELKAYEKKFGFVPNVSIIRVGSSSTAMTQSMKGVGIDAEVLVCDKIDNVSKPNVIRLLSRTSVFDLVMEIGSLQLPVKSDIKRK